MIYLLEILMKIQHINHLICSLLYYFINIIVFLYIKIILDFIDLILNLILFDHFFSILNLIEKLFLFLILFRYLLFFLVI